jgi:hypothetical protein
VQRLSEEKRNDKPEDQGLLILFNFGACGFFSPK